jgi:hypothetical protein
VHLKSSDKSCNASQANLEEFMKKHLALLLLATPITALVACGTSQSEQPRLSNQESSLLNAGALADESEELVADQVEELSEILELEDNSSAGLSTAFALAREKDSSLEKSCRLVDGKIILSRDKTKSKDLDKSTRKGRVEIALARESSFERIYSPAEGKELAIASKTDKGPISFLNEKVSDLPGSKAESKHSRKSERSLKLDGVPQKSRKSESEGSRAVVFSAASLKEGLLTMSKSVSFNSTSTVTKEEKGVSSLSKNERKTLEESPLKIEVVRNSETGKLVHKLIQSGQVQVSRGESSKIDIVYEQVKFVADCKPVSGQLLITKNKQEAGESSVRVLKIRFADGEAMVSRDGGPEKKMESLNIRLETCRS